MILCVYANMAGFGEPRFILPYADFDFVINFAINNSFSLELFELFELFELLPQPTSITSSKSAEHVNSSLGMLFATKISSSSDSYHYFHNPPPTLRRQPLSAVV